MDCPAALPPARAAVQLWEGPQPATPLPLCRGLCGQESRKAEGMGGRGKGDERGEDAPCPRRISGRTTEGHLSALPSLAEFSTARPWQRFWLVVLG